MGQNHDYQKGMSNDAAAIDRQGEDASETYAKPVSHARFSGPDKANGTIIQDLGTIGLMPAVPIPADYALEKATEFREMAIETGGSRNPITGGTGDMRESDAFKSQMKVAEHYAEDANVMGAAQRDYDVLAPSANLATRSYEKFSSVNGGAKRAGYTGDVSNAEHDALEKGNHQKGGALLTKTASLGSLSKKVKSTRGEVIVASDQLNYVLKEQVIKKLQGEVTEAKEDREKIEQKIERIAHYVGYVETAASLVAGGAGAVGFMTERAEAAEVLKSFESGESQIAPAKGGAEGVAKKAEMVGKVGEKAEGITKDIITSFYHDQLAHIDSKITAITSEISNEDRMAVEAQLNAAHANMTLKANEHGDALGDYQAAIDDRRDKMGAVGKEADSVAGKGTHGASSKAALVAATTMETQSQLDVALDAGTGAASSINHAVHTVHVNREERWGTLADVAAFSQTNKPNHEGNGGPDITALTRMQQLMIWWVQGAERAKREVDDQAAGDAYLTIDAMGYDQETATY